MTLVTPDLAEMLGQSTARRAAEVCAAGGHHLSLLGPPGAGKTMLAERIPTILPRLDTAAALEVLNTAGLRAIVAHAVAAADRRSAELAAEYGAP